MLNSCNIFTDVFTQMNHTVGKGEQLFAPTSDHTTSLTWILQRPSIRTDLQPLIEQLQAGEILGDRIAGVIATALAVRTPNARRPQWHLVNNQTAPVFYGFDFLAKTNIFQLSLDLENKGVSTIAHNLHFESILEYDHLYEMWHYPLPQPVQVQVLEANKSLTKFLYSDKLFDHLDKLFVTLLS